MFLNIKYCVLLNSPVFLLHSQGKFKIKSQTMSIIGNIKTNRYSKGIKINTYLNLCDVEY